MATYEDLAILAGSANSNTDTYLHDIAENENAGANISSDYIRDKYGLLVHTFWETAIMGMFLTSLTSDEAIALLENVNPPLASDAFPQAPERTPTYVRFKSPVDNIVTLHISMSWIFKWINRLNDCIDRYMPKEMHEDLKIDSVAFAYYETSTDYTLKYNNIVPIGTFWSPTSYKIPLKVGITADKMMTNKTNFGFYIHGTNLNNAYLNYPNSDERASCFIHEDNFSIPLNHLTALWKSSNGFFNTLDSINLESSGIPYMIQTGDSITPIDLDKYPTLLRPSFYRLNNLTGIPYTSNDWCVARIHPVFFNKRGETLNNPCFGWDVTSGLANLFSQKSYDLTWNEPNVSISRLLPHNFVNKDLYTWYMNYNAATASYSQMGDLNYTVGRKHGSFFYFFPDYDKLFSVYGRTNNFVFKIPTTNMYTANGYPYRVYPNFGNIGEYGGLCYNSSIRIGRTSKKNIYSLVDPNLSSKEYIFGFTSDEKGLERLLLNAAVVVI